MFDAAFTDLSLAATYLPPEMAVDGHETIADDMTARSRNFMNRWYQPFRREGHRWSMLWGLLIVLAVALSWTSLQYSRISLPFSRMSQPKQNATSQPLASSPQCAAPGQAQHASSAGASSGGSSQQIIDMCLLVISADGTEPDLAAITQSLEDLGTPYALFVATRSPAALTANALASGNHAFYQGVILTTDTLAYLRDSAFVSALSPTEWRALNTFEAKFHLRQITWYTYPAPNYGYQSATPAIDTGKSPISAQFTSAGQAIFPYVNASNSLTIQGAYTYLAPPLNSPSVVPLLLDSSGNALAVTQRYSDGRENLAMTFDSNAAALYSLVLDQGLINWVTRGLFLGDRHIYLTPQADDLFLPDRERLSSTPCVPSATTSSATDLPADTSTASYRITGGDLQKFADWERTLNAQPTIKQVRLTFAFNGFGARPQNPSSDGLTSAVLRLQDQFYFVSHTYGHVKMDNMSYNNARSELQSNDTTARELALHAFSPLNLVTPEISGLFNPQVLQAAYDSGIRYLVTDTSRKGENSPSPNAGLYNRFQPAILMIPRYPTNLGYDVSTPAEEVAEYNCTYASSFHHPLTYSEIIDSESQKILVYMLKGDIDPIAFHQTNLRAYDGRHTVLSDLLDAVFAKYTKLFNLPVMSLQMNNLGQQMASRMQYDAAGVTASIVPGRSITLTARQAATVPVTGLRANGAELYGSQYISYIHLNAGQSVTLPLL